MTKTSLSGDSQLLADVRLCGVFWNLILHEKRAISTVKPTESQGTGTFSVVGRLLFVQVLEFWQISVLQFLHKHPNFSTDFVKYNFMSRSETF
jgi:hypothetical protein